MPRSSAPPPLTTDVLSNLSTAKSTSPEPEGGRISPTFAQFAYLDGAVRKTRNRAYQKSGGNDGEVEQAGSPESVQHGQGPSTTASAVKLHKNKSSFLGLRTPAFVSGGQMKSVCEEEGGASIICDPKLSPQHSLPEAQTTGPYLTENCMNTRGLPQLENNNFIERREMEKRNNIIYGYPISLLTSPTRNWMPILDKNSLIYQAITEVMESCNLRSAVPMIARRLSWIGKGKSAPSRPSRNKLGKFTKSHKDTRRSVATIGTGDPVEHEELSLEEERRRLVGGILDLRTVVDGIETARASSQTVQSAITTAEEFVDVEIPIHILLAGIESIAFTSLGFYRIYVPERNQPLPLSELPNRPSKLNWDPYASRIGRVNSIVQPPWIVRFMGYEWEAVRTELLDEDNCEEDESKEWVTTMSGFRVLKLQEDFSDRGGGAKSHSEPVTLVTHPWGRDILEPPPVGVYATQGGYEGVVRDWFPWAWDIVRELNGEGSHAPAYRKHQRRKAAVVADRKVKDSSMSSTVGGKSGFSKNRGVDAVIPENELEEPMTIASRKRGSREGGNMEGMVKRSRV